MSIPFPAILTTVMAGDDLTAEQMTATMDALMEGELTPAQTGALLTALRIKGESITELAAAALSMRAHATRIDPGPAPVVDTCGTGGDASGTFNISTTAAFIAAGAGVKIAKHGNRGVSSRSGSADLLQCLGVNLEATPETVGACVREVGIGFLFAPRLHGAMKYAIGPRRELGVRTIFNMLGPLTNPAGATAQVLGVFDPALTTVFARVLGTMGSRCALVVHGADGLDEITTCALTRIAELRDGSVREHTFDPRPHIGGAFADIADLQGGEPETNAAITRAILDGQPGPRADIAIINAAAAIRAAERADSWEEAVTAARRAVESRAARAKLDALVRRSNQA